jgi:PilZ domain
MRKASPEARPKSIADERRHLPRKRVLLAGVIADKKGENAIDCTIQDINVHGAQVQLPSKLQQGDEVYLLNTRTEIACLATVARVDDEQSGLSFVRTYTLELPVPPHLNFLRRLLIEAKFRQLKSLTGRGVSAQDAARVVGITEDFVERFVMHGPFDGRVALLLDQARELLSKS